MSGARCKHCGTPIYLESDDVWAHANDDRYFCWVHEDYTDADYAEPNTPTTQKADR